MRGSSGEGRGTEIGNTELRGSIRYQLVSFAAHLIIESASRSRDQLVLAVVVNFVGRAPNAYTTSHPILSTMASSTQNGGGHDGEIRLWQEDDWWVAKDVETGVTTQGESRTAALKNLDDAVALHDGEHGRAPTDEELREAGIDPADNTTGDREPPDVLD